MIFVSVVKILAGFVEESMVLENILDFVGNTAFFSILGAHLLFNMKEAGEKGLNQGTNCGTKSTVSNIDFAAAGVTSAGETSET